MMKLLKNILIILLLNQPFLLFAEAIHEVTIEYAGSLGSQATMHFVRQGQRYAITVYFKAPFTQVNYLSKGSINSNFLKSQQFTDTHYGKIASSAVFDHARQKIIYGKNGYKKQVRLQGNSYDILSFPWQIALSPHSILGLIQLITGRGVYTFYVPKDIVSISHLEYLKTPKGIVTMQVYDLRKISHGKAPMVFGYVSQFKYLPLFIRFHNHIYDIKLQATHLKIDGQGIF